MGLFSTLLSSTGPGKMMAAQNALAAKYTFMNLDDHMKSVVKMQIRELLKLGGMSEPDEFIKTMKEDRFFGIAAIAMSNLGVKPGLSNILFKNEWNWISNPLVALYGARREIDMVILEIKRKHGIEISLAM